MFLSRLYLLFYFIIIFSLKNEFFNDHNLALFSECKVYSLSGQIISSYDGDDCVHLKDGRVVVASYYNQFVKLISKGNDLIWKINTTPHHDIQVSFDKTRVYFLSFKFQKIKKTITRSDVLNIVSMDGGLVSTWDIQDHLSEIAAQDDYFKIYYAPLSVKNDKIFNASFELSHINSFKEVPPNPLYPAVEFLRPGNFVVSMNCHGLVLFLNSKLTKIEKVLRIDSGFHCNSHDLQVLENGLMLNYNNNLTTPDHGSYLEMIDPIGLDKIWTYPSLQKQNGRTMGLNKIHGSVQLLSNGNFLYTDNSNPFNNVFEITKNGKIVNLWKLKSTLSQSLDKGIYKVKLFGNPRPLP